MRTAEVIQRFPTWRPELSPVGISLWSRGFQWNLGFSSRLFICCSRREVLEVYPSNTRVSSGIVLLQAEGRLSIVVWPSMSAISNGNARKSETSRTIPQMNWLTSADIMNLLQRFKIAIRNSIVALFAITLSYYLILLFAGERKLIFQQFVVEKRQFSSEQIPLNLVLSSLLLGTFFCDCMHFNFVDCHWKHPSLCLSGDHDTAIKKCAIDGTIFLAQYLIWLALPVPLCRIFPPILRKHSWKTFGILENVLLIKRWVCRWCKTQNGGVICYETISARVEQS